MSLKNIGSENVSLNVFGGRCSESSVPSARKQTPKGFWEEGGANCSAVCRALVRLPFPQPAAPAVAEGVGNYLFRWEPTEQLPPGLCLIRRDLLSQSTHGSISLGPQFE